MQGFSVTVTREKKKKLARVLCNCIGTLMVQWKASARMQGLIPSLTGCIFGEKPFDPSKIASEVVWIVDLSSKCQKQTAPHQS